MNRFTSSIAIAILVVAGAAGCKKDKSKDAAAGGAKGTTAAKEGAKEGAKPAACAAGFTNLGDAGVCVKVPEGMKPDTSIGPHSGGKRVVFRGEGGASIDLYVQETSDMMYKGHKENLLAGGGFGGKLLEQGKLGTKGAWGVFDVDGGDRKVNAAIEHNGKVEVECQAWKEVHSTVGPKLEVMMDICKTMTVL